MIRPTRTRHHAALSTSPCSLLQSCLCTQWITSSIPSPQQLSSFLGLPSTCQDLACGPSLSCQGGRVLHAPWGMHLTQGTHKWSPEASCCTIHRNCHNATPCRATTSWNGLQVTQQAPAIEKTAGAPVCMTGPACRSMQRHGQPTALSQQFPFAPSERERLCTLLRVCIYRWGPSKGPQNLSTGLSQRLQHATAWAANSSVTAVLVRS